MAGWRQPTALIVRLAIAAKDQDAGDVLELRVVPAQGRRRRKGDAIIKADPIRVLFTSLREYPVPHGMESSKLVSKRMTKRS